MHEARIAGLERRLANLAGKVGDPRWAPEFLAADVERTQDELNRLKGICDRHAAWVEEAPAVVAQEAIQIERRRSLKERRQKTRPEP